MSVYDKAASAVLDTLWEEIGFRTFFHNLGYELADLGPLIPRVFVPAYLSVKATLEPEALDLLETQVTKELLIPLAKRPHFREAWEHWDQATRDSFLREQSEMQLGRLLVMVYDNELATAYKNAFLSHIRSNGA
ncbi:MAG: hypothetical protein JW966_03815 [Anaerolineae bacterium]|nr:hypothetical protein [Anaerolineae bacterium]